MRKLFLITSSDSSFTPGAVLGLGTEKARPATDLSERASYAFGATREQCRVHRM
jgi:hypothetical protein